MGRANRMPPELHRIVFGARIAAIHCGIRSFMMEAAADCPLIRLTTAR